MELWCNAQIPWEVVTRRSTGAQALMSMTGQLECAAVVQHAAASRSAYAVINTGHQCNSTNDALQV